MSGAWARCARAARVLLVAAIAAAHGFVLAAGEDELVSLINARRAETRGCSGAREEAQSPLAPSSLLARVDASAASGDLGKALIDGRLPRRDGDDARAVGRRRCGRGGAPGRAAALRRGPQPSLQRDRRRTKRLALARESGRAAPRRRPRRLARRRPAVLALVNEARRRGASCGAQRFAAAAPLAWNDQLAAAALGHARDMAEHEYFDHADRRGRGVGQRAREIGYPWRAIGENIAAGQGSARAGRRRLAGQPRPLRQHPLAEFPRDGHRLRAQPAGGDGNLLDPGVRRALSRRLVRRTSELRTRAARAAARRGSAAPRRS